MLEVIKPNWDNLPLQSLELPVEFTQLELHPIKLDPLENIQLEFLEVELSQLENITIPDFNILGG